MMPNSTIQRDDRDGDLFCVVEQATVWIAAVALSLMPLCGHELWWHLVRGRAVLNGEFQPTQFLVVNEQWANSDWLSGTIPWLIFSGCGVSGLMLLKIGAALLVAWWLYRQHGGSALWPILSVVFLVAIQAAFEPSSATIDLLGICFAVGLAKARRLVLLALLTVVWTNFSVGAIWILPIVGCFSLSDSSTSPKTALAWLGLLLLCLCVCPRGFYALKDMGMLFAPWAFNHSAFLAETTYASCRVSLPVLAGLTISTVVVVFPNVAVSRKLIVATVTVLGLLNGAIFSLAAAFSGLMLLEAVKDWNPQKTGRMILRTGLWLAGVAIVLVQISGGIDRRGERLGWGVADSNDIRYLERDLYQYQQSELRVHCTDISGAGMLCFALPNAKVMDVPEAAIRGGRLHRFCSLNHDLATGRKAEFVRQNGLSGGWWRGLINEDVSLLVVPPKREAILKSLEPTLWKPLSLDAPELIFAVAGQPQFISPILQARAQRELIEFGEWRHEVYSQSTMSFHEDLWEAVTGVADNRADLRQAQTFRSMQMRMGAVRTLLPVLRSGGTPSAQPEFAKIQQLIAWQEWLNCGQVSSLRLQTLAELCGEISIFGIPAEELVVDAESSISDRVVRLYCSGDALLAAELIASSTAEALYAKHCLRWEAGDAENAELALQELEEAFPDHPVTGMTRLLHDVK